MIRYIKGTYTMQFDTGIVVETGSGVGFEIFVHQGSPIYKQSEGDEIQVFTEMVVREDGMSLYGFHNRETLEFFKMLTAVSGIGPKGAMGILGSMPLTELKLAIAMGDVKSISKAQGVGKKTARQMILDLKGKLADVVPDAFVDLFSDEERFDEKKGSSAELDEALEALRALGYAEREVSRVVPELLKESLTTDQYIKKALSLLLNGKR